MGVSSSTKNPIDMHCSPYCSIGIKTFPSLLSGFLLIDIILGNDGPYKSASRTPTFNPAAYNAVAMFMAKVDFPTPPFALDTAMVNFVPFIGFLVNVLGAVLFFKLSLKPSVFLSMWLS